jgi:hypothetical protein
VTPAPGLALTLWERPDQASALVSQIRPDVVILHATPTAAHGAMIADLRRASPGVRVWYQLPGNPYAAGSLNDDLFAIRACVRGALALGAEVLSINGEGASSPGGASWASDDPSARAALGERASRILAAAAAESAGRLALAWSSHDCPLWHHLPWAAIFGTESPVALSLHQHYPSDGKSQASRAACLARLKTSADQWARLGPSACRPELAPEGSAAVLYTQAHGLSVAGACALYDRSALAAAWALPTRHDADGILALRADAAMRREVGHAPGRIVRYQSAHGLAPDGVVGPRTLAALGLA